jgi:hypothetical protein
MMPRTPAPLTVEPFIEYVVRDSAQQVIATFIKPADARAFVALPDLIAGAKIALLMWDTDDPKYIKEFGALQAALAQADGPMEAQ